MDQVEQPNLVLAAILACLYDEDGKGEIDNDRREGEEQIQPQMPHFMITKPEQGQDSFQYPEKKNTSCEHRGPLPGRDVIEIMDKLMHMDGGFRDDL